MRLFKYGSENLEKHSRTSAIDFCWLYGTATTTTTPNKLDISISCCIIRFRTPERGDFWKTLLIPTQAQTITSELINLIIDDLHCCLFHFHFMNTLAKKNYKSKFLSVSASLTFWALTTKKFVLLSSSTHTEMWEANWTVWLLKY